MFKIPGRREPGTSVFVSPSGSRMKSTYQLEIEPDGNRKLVKTGEVDTYEITQSHKAACTIDNIVKRAMAGDPTALSQAQGVYMDTTLLPTDLISANEAVRRAESMYKHLPADVRAKFGGFKAFVDQFGTLEGVTAFFNEMASNGENKASEPIVEAEGGSSNE